MKQHTIEVVLHALAFVGVIVWYIVRKGKK